MDNCSGLTDPEMIKMCVYMSDQIAQVKIQPWITGLIGVGAAALTAFLSTSGSNLLQKKERRNISQREALHLAQDTALKLRRKWIAYKDQSGTFSDADQKALTGKLDLYLSRVNSDEVTKAFKEWADYAQLYFSGFEQFQAYEEEARWATSVQKSGVKLKALD